MKNVLVTGGCGFIGSYLVRHLIRKNCNVVVIDNLSNSNRESCSKFAHFCEIDIRQTSLVEKTLIQYDIDTIFHLAAISGVEACEKNIDLAHDVNITSIENLVSIAKKYDVKNMFFTSSSAVYGESNTLNYVGKMLSPIGLYGKQKLVGEKIISNNFPNSSVILRLANVYGYGQNTSYGAVMPNFIKNALLDKPLIIYGNGNQCRSFIHVQDLSENIFKIMQKTENENINKTVLMNCGTVDSTSIKNLAELIIKCAKSRSVITYKNSRKNDIKQSKFLPDELFLKCGSLCENKIVTLIEEYKKEILKEGKYTMSEAYKTITLIIPKEIDVGGETVIYGDALDWKDYIGKIFKIKGKDCGVVKDCQEISDYSIKLTIKFRAENIKYFKLNLASSCNSSRQALSRLWNHQTSPRSS